jgi:hypothetical protein
MTSMDGAPVPALEARTLRFGLCISAELFASAMPAVTVARLIRPMVHLKLKPEMVPR